MSGLSSNPGLPKPFEFNPYTNLWAPELAQLYNPDVSAPDYSISGDDVASTKDRKKRRKKTKKRHSKFSKQKKRDHRLQGYILQVIGLLCFILAAVKAFEPLTGVGFTLVLIGYNKNAKKEDRVDLGTKREPTKAEGKERKHRRRTIEVEEDLLLEDSPHVEGISPGRDTD